MASWDHWKELLRGKISLSKICAKTRASNKISMSCRIALFNNSSDRCSPSVVTPRIQKSLVHSSTYEVLFKILLIFLWKRVSIEHLSQRIFVIFKPKSIFPLHIEVRIVMRKWLWVVYNFIFIIIHRPSLFFYFASKPIMPTIKAIVRGILIANVVIVVYPF